MDPSVSEKRPLTSNLKLREKFIIRLMTVDLWRCSPKLRRHGRVCHVRRSPVVQLLSYETALHSDIYALLGRARVCRVRKKRNACGEHSSANLRRTKSGRVHRCADTGNDQMKFSVTEIRAKPGETLSVTLANVGTMPKMSMGHNWVLLKSPAVVEGFVNAAMTAPTTDYIPADKKGDMIAHTKLLGPKEKDTVTFNAPKEPGRYPFVCTFPGHFQVGMKGELIVE